ncbi:MAG TPA: hypothetical protein ENG87_03370 [Candidatus Pacearchaeota archaeon]|nr:hypothetical protein BMS3Abin17_01331 [archaeon BMS3Abin17]HDK42394.1 hypothetical protein [Candidatus Pacearchaeota archaeon]HDZ60934.1 hypothetical protein [Candidatus Pacearchaeota archaeon]
MSEKKSAENLIFLNDESICDWERPLRKGYFRMPKYWVGSTEIVEFMGSDFVREGVVGSYFINASASKYLADIIPFSHDVWTDNQDIKPERRLLFEGGIQIFREGEIPGTKIKGNYLIINKKIWCAKEPKDNLVGANALKNLLFEETPKHKTRIERVKAIVDGYLLQEELRDKRLQESISSEYSRGKGMIL